MGVVYKARQVGLNRLVALKMIRGSSQASPELLARFPIEAEIIAGLRHANILQIYHIGEGWITSHSYRWSCSREAAWRPAWRAHPSRDDRRPSCWSRSPRRFMRLTRLASCTVT